MNKFISRYVQKIDTVQSREEVFQEIDQTIQKEIPDSYVVCLQIDQETFEFIPVRSVDKVLLPNVEPYMDQGIFAEALTAGKPFYVFDSNRYEFKDDEALIIFPLFFGGKNYGVILIVTKQEVCKQMLNEQQEEINEFWAVSGKMVQLYSTHEESLEKGEAVKGDEATASDIIESVVHGVIVFNQNNEIKFFNKNAEVIFGISAKETIGKNYRDIFPDRVTRSFDLLMQNTLIEGSILDFEIEVELNPELKIPVGITTSLIVGQQNENKGVVFICRDMSLTKEVNRLKELDKMKSEFVSTVSHELKNPIAVMKSSVETLMAAKKLGKDLGPEFEMASMTTVNEEIDRLSELINDLLSLSRIESGKVELNRQPQDIQDLLETSIHLFEVSKNTHPITLECNTTGTVLLDYDKIKQVVINFINNAIKYSPNGSDILIKAEQTESKVTISVSDHGLGIPKEQVGKVFDKFYRVSSEDTATIGGTGLGLAISRKIIELHHGKIWVKSEIDKGSTFGFDLFITSYNKQGQSDSPEAGLEEAQDAEEVSEN